MTTKPAETPTFTAEAQLTAKHDERVKVIVGSIIGGVAFLLLVLIGVILYLRRQRRKKGPNEGFRQDIANGNARGPGKDGRREEAKPTSRRSKEISISSTTPLREDFVGDAEGDQSSLSVSATGKRSLTVSDISDRSKSSSEEAGDIPILPLIPVLINPPLSTDHSKTPSIISSMSNNKHYGATGTDLRIFETVE
ncbi:hypothetical protein PQX77_014950 [Marasmius sp. AFHP31]|nr:hypothetical protein PQX77_014950 [Marasmius sp. AFHP31]